MGSDEHPYELPVYELARRYRVGAPAGVFLLEGRCHVAAYRSARAHELVELGALHVATLRFDPDPRERTHAQRPVRRLGAPEMVRRYPPGPGES